MPSSPPHAQPKLSVAPCPQPKREHGRFVNWGNSEGELSYLPRNVLKPPKKKKTSMRFLLTTPLCIPCHQFNGPILFKTTV